MAKLTKYFDMKKKFPKINKSLLRFRITSGVCVEFDIIAMQGTCQNVFQHAVLPAPDADECGLRINLTFRNIINHCESCRSYNPGRINY